MKKILTGACVSLVVLLLVFLVVTKLELKLAGGFFPQSVELDGKSKSHSSGSATSGKLFLGSKLRSYPNRIFNNNLNHAFGDGTVAADGLNCEKWSVVTTIFPPSEAVRRQAHMAGWCLVVVGDRKGPETYDIENPLKNFIFLTVAMQEDMAKTFPLVDVLPWNHFGRKNIGYIYAIQHGAHIIWDFDDDNILLTKHHMFELIPGASSTQKKIESNSTIQIPPPNPLFVVLEAVTYSKNKMLSFNPYPLMDCPTKPCWPRGLPLQDIKFDFSTVVLKPVKVATSSIGIIQSLANQDPDVDAMYRLTQPIPFDFPSKGFSLAVPIGSYAPYNAQATLHMQPTLWALMLPVTVHGRVSDIWRGYVVQRIMMLLNLRLIFSPALVKQERNTHNYLADFESENDLYLRSQKLLEQLSEWNPSEIALNSAYPLCACIEELWVMLYEHGYIEIGDIVLTHAWLKSLLYAGYKFPSLVANNATTVGLTPIVSPIKNNNSNIQVDIEVANMTTIKKQLPTLANTSNTSTERVEMIVISNDKKIKPGSRTQLKKRMRL